MQLKSIAIAVSTVLLFAAPAIADPFPNTLWIGNDTNASLGILNTTKSGTVVRTIPNTAGIGFAIDESTNSLYINGGDGIHVSVRDLDTLAQTRALVLPHTSEDLTFSGGFLWAGNFSGNALDKIDPNTGARVGGFNLGFAPLGITTDGSSGLWVSEFTSGALIRHFSGSGTLLGTLNPGIEGFRGGLAYDPSDGTLFIGGSGTVYHYTTSGVSLGSFSTGDSRFVDGLELAVPSTSTTLNITKSHVGFFVQGQTGATYSVIVTNNSGGSTSGAIAVTETVPTGLTLVSMSGGSTWNCPTGGNTCTTNNVLAPGQSFPAITVTVNVSPTASSPQVNQVTVSGGNTISATATDSTEIKTPTPAAWSITKTHAGNFTQGKNASYTVTVTNMGGQATSGAVTVTDTLPAGLTLVSMSGTGWSANGTRSDSLAPSASFPPLTITVSVSPNATSPVINQATVSGGGATASATSSPDSAIVNAVCSYSFAGSPASVGSGSGTFSASLTATSSCTNQYTVVSNNDWITITPPASGHGSGSIGYSVSTNNSGGQRTGSFTVLDTGVAVATFTVNQAAGSCSSLTFSPNNFSFGQAGGTGKVNFSTSPCSWTVTGAPSWITLNPPSGTGTGSSFSFTVQPNLTGAARTPAVLTVSVGSVTIGTVTINQAGPVCSYTIKDSQLGFGTSRGFSASGGSGGIDVSAPAGCSWTATTNNPSLIKISGTGQGKGNGSVGYTVTANTIQSGTITIGGAVFTITETAGQGYACSASAGGSATLRPEGFAENVADILLNCSGQAPATGISGDIIVSFAGVNITNLLLSNGQTDALLLEDAPTPQTLALGTNAFRGAIATVNNKPVILFPAVQLVAAGGGTSHSWRITNMRVDAESAGGAQIQATVSILSSSLLTGPTTQPVVASIGAVNDFHSLAESPGPNTNQIIHPVTFMEGFKTAYRPRLAANQDPSQAGTSFNAESGYVNSAVLGAQTGFATSGTRLIAVVANVPAGVNVFAPVGPSTPPSGSMAQLISADSTGTGGFPVPGTVIFGGVSYQPVTLTSGTGTATWEVTSSDPAAIEALNFNLLLDNPNGANLSAVTYAGALAPVTSGNAARLPSSTAPVPRFASSSITVGNPPKSVTLSVVPLTGSGQGQGQGQSQSQAEPQSRSLAAQTIAPNSQTVGTINWTEEHAAASTNTTTATNPSASITLPPTWVLTGCTIKSTGGNCLSVDPNNPGNNRMLPYPSQDPGQTVDVDFSAQSPAVTSGFAETTSSISSDQPNDDTDGSQYFNQSFAVSTVGLTVITAHANFTPGQNGATYTATVSNGGNAALTGGVTVTETVPAGLTLVSMAGQGWTCNPPSTSVAANTCVRSDSLGSNAGYPPITITVNVASTVQAPSTVTNQVVASASVGLLKVTFSDPTNIVVGGPCTYSFSPTTATATSSAGTGSVSVITTPATNCPWTVVSDMPWLTISPPASGNGSGTVNYAVSANAGAQRTGTLSITGQTPTFKLTQAGSHAPFFNGEVPLGNGFYYLQFPNGTIFGYYNYAFSPWIFHSDLGFEYFIDAADGAGGAYMYDAASGHWFFTNPATFPALYDFTLKQWIWYFADSKNPGHYTSNPRSFVFLTGSQKGVTFTM